MIGFWHRNRKTPKRVLTATIAALFVALQLPLITLMSPAAYADNLQTNTPQPDSLVTGTTQQISAKALTDHECNNTEWHFVITQVDVQADAPSSIHVTWANGASADITLTDYTGKTAHYATTANLDSTVTSATATIYAGWSGEFNLSHGPCQVTPPPVTGTVVVNKVATKDGVADTTTQFSITASGTGTITETPTQSITGGSSVTYHVTAGAYGVVENNLSTGWVQTGNTCSNLVIDAGNTSQSCTITNSYTTPPPVTGTLTIIKDAQPDSSQAFGFTSNVSGHTSFSLTDNGPGSNNTESMTGLSLSHSYTVTESATDGWTLSNITCEDANVTEDLSGRSVSVTLSDSQKDVTCTFVNTRVPDTVNVPICHRTDSETNPYVYIPNLSAAGAYNGHYTEHQGDVWYPGHPKEPKWGDIIPPFVYNGHTYSLNWNDAGMTIYRNGCKVTQPGSITIIKHADPSTTQKFHFTSNISGSHYFTLKGDNVAAHDTRTMNHLLYNHSYTISEAAMDGWALRSIDCGDASVQVNMTNRSVTITLSSDQQNVTCTFNNYQPGHGGGPTGTISGFKFDDYNGNGAYDQNEHKLSGWTINLYDSDGNLVTSAQTDVSGNYSFTGLELTRYKVCESQQSGWTQMAPGSNGGCYTVDLTEANTTFTEANFGNFKLGTISGYKFNDQNGNGRLDGSESKLSGWTIQLYKVTAGIVGSLLQSATTDVNGNYSFTGLMPGDYQVCEVEQSGWTQILPGNDSCYMVTISTSGQVVTENFGNQQNFTPGRGGETLTTPTPTAPTPSNELVNTGSSALLNLFAGLSILGAVAGVAMASRKRAYSS